jgi:hypothetical protein
LDKKIRGDISERKKECRQLSKQRKPLLDALEHHEMKKERQAGEARKKKFKLT